MEQNQVKNYYNQGFTIVELIIVIVVIGVLAAISVVAYSNVANKSSNMRTVANIKQYREALEVYKANKGHYPRVPGEGGAYVTMVCLGYGYVDGQCGVVTDTDVFESADFMKEIQTESGISMTGVINERSGAVGGESFTGAVYGIDMVDSKYTSTGRGRIISWVMEGPDQDCVISGSWGYNSSTANTACEIVLEEY